MKSLVANFKRNFELGTWIVRGSQARNYWDNVQAPALSRQAKPSCNFRYIARADSTEVTRLSLDNFKAFAAKFALPRTEVTSVTTVSTPVSVTVSATSKPAMAATTTVTTSTTAQTAPQVVSVASASAQCVDDPRLRPKKFDAIWVREFQSGTEQAEIALGFSRELRQVFVSSETIKLHSVKLTKDANKGASGSDGSFVIDGLQDSIPMVTRNMPDEFKNYWKEQALPNRQLLADYLSAGDGATTYPCITRGPIPLDIFLFEAILRHSGAELDPFAEDAKNDLLCNISPSDPFAKCTEANWATFFRDRKQPASTATTVRACLVSRQELADATGAQRRVAQQLEDEKTQLQADNARLKGEKAKLQTDDMAVARIQSQNAALQEQLKQLQQDLQDSTRPLVECRALKAKCADIKRKLKQAALNRDFAVDDETEDANAISKIEGLRRSADAAAEEAERVAKARASTAIDTDFLTSTPGASSGSVSSLSSSSSVSSSSGSSSSPGAASASPNTPPPGAATSQGSSS